MKTSAVSFNDMLRFAANNPTLGVAASYMQVEYGLDELLACWEGFVNTSDHYGLEFRTRKQVCQEFSNNLNDYLEYLGEPIPKQLGQAVSTHR